MASVVMFSDFDQNQLFVVGLSWAFKNNLIPMIHGHHDNLVTV